MRNPDPFLAGAHAAPSEVSFQDGRPIRPLSECPAPCARAGRRLKPFQRQAGCPEWSRGRLSGAFVGALGERDQPPDPLVGVQPHLEAGRTVPISVAAAATLRATVVANSGVDIDPGAVRALALGGTQRVSGPPGAILRPPISIAVSVSV